VPLIDYQSQGFPAGAPVMNGFATLNVTWRDLLTAAVTVGRPNRAYVFQHGAASKYEALFRWSLIRMAVEQFGPAAHRLRRTDAAKTLDPTEKGAVSYFLGMAVCKMFAEKLLDTPWLMHLDVFRAQIGAVLREGSRPDLIGQSRTGQWMAFESKGRISQPDATTKTKAKGQARRCIRVNTTPVTFHIGAITYLANDVLRFFWRDPEPNEDELRNAFRITVSDADWFYYYAPVFDLVRANRDTYERMLREPVLLRVEEADLEIGIEPQVLKFLSQGQWSAAREWCNEHAARLRQSEAQADGIRLVPGQSWLAPFERRE
jgi:hypothetical protein